MALSYRFGQKEAVIHTFMVVLKLFGLTSRYCLVCPAKLLYLYVYVDEIMSETRVECGGVAVKD